MTSHFTIPSLNDLEPMRIDEQLGNKVNELLMLWIDEMGLGLSPHQREKIKTTNFGRLAMLSHPDTDDIERLLLSAQYMTWYFSIDEYYCDEKQLGAVPILVAPRLLMNMAIVDPVILPPKYLFGFEEHINNDPILLSARDCYTRVKKIATPAQIARIHYEAMLLFMAMDTEASWRMKKFTPSVWQYLIHRKMNSFLPCMAMIDIIGGYEVPTLIYFSEPVRHVCVLAAIASNLQNDLYSMEKELNSELTSYNLPQQLAIENNCSLQDAFVIAVEIHDGYMNEYEIAEKSLLNSQYASPEVERFLLGIKGWMNGCFEWQKSSSRYLVT